MSGAFCVLHFFFVCGIGTITLIHSYTLLDVQLLKKSLFVNQEYDKLIRPLYDQTQAIEVEVYLGYTSLKGIDMITGTATIHGYVLATWTDEQLAWNTTEYNGLLRITVSATEDIWTPEFTQFYTSDSSDASTLTPVWVLYTGQVLLMTSRVFEGVCYLDIFRYPIDEHSCHIDVAPMRHDVTEVNFKIFDKGTDHMIYGENGEWEVIDSNQEIAHVIDEGTGYHLIGMRRSFTFRRRSLFTMIHTVLPLGLLFLLNIMMYMVPINSGERISYAVSIFLAFVFFTSTTINDTLPNSSLTISCYSITVTLINTSTTLGVIFSVILCRLSNEQMRPIPDILKHLTVKYRSKGTKTIRDTKVEPFRSDEKTHRRNTVHKEADANKIAGEEAHLEQRDITWADVSEMLDRILFYANLFIVLLLVILSCILLFTYKK